jgi:hypothetical protein
VAGPRKWRGSLRENAETYRATYPEVLKTLAKVVVGPPQAHMLEVTNWTFRKIAVSVAV